MASAVSTPEMVTILVKAEARSSSLAAEETAEAQEEAAPNNPFVASPSASTVPLNATTTGSQGTVEIPHAWLTIALFEVLEVSGCTCPKNGPAVRGTYIECSENCGHPVYRRTELFEDSQVLLYYWDESDGADWSGWWFGNEATSDSAIYGYNPAKGLPPRTGWRADSQGPTDDTFLVEVATDEANHHVRDSWFEAKLDRWQNKEEPPHITLEVPQECDASEGARLLKLRIQSRFQAISKGTRPQDRWDPLKWWKVTNGQIRALEAALHIFHMTLLEFFADEVAAALATYGLPCSKSTATIAMELEHGVSESLQGHAALRFDLPTLQKMVNDACSSVLEGREGGSGGGGSGEKGEGLQFLADRAIAGSPPTKEVVKILVNAWFSCFVTSIPDRELGLDPSTDPPMPMLGSEKEGSPASWVVENLARLIRRRVDSYVDVVEEVSARLPLNQEFVQVRRVDDRHNPPHLVVRTSERVQLDEDFGMSLLDVFSTCHNALFVESALRPALSHAISMALRMGMRWLFPIACCEQPRSWACWPGVDGTVFAVASLEVQRAYLEALPVKCYHHFWDQAHFVHQEARHMLAPHAASLSPKDVRFLARASFPVIEVPADDASTSEGTAEGAGEPPVKRSRCW